jgi:hypothetical protein
MLPGDRARIERGYAGSISSRVRIDIFSQTTKDTRFASECWHHAAQKQKIAGLNGGHVGAERGWCGRELDSQLPQPLFRPNQGPLRPTTFRHVRLHRRAGPRRLPDALR